MNLLTAEPEHHWGETAAAEPPIPSVEAEVPHTQMEEPRNLLGELEAVLRIHLLGVRPEPRSEPLCQVSGKLSHMRTGDGLTERQSRP